MREINDTPHEGLPRLDRSDPSALVGLDNSDVARLETSARDPVNLSSTRSLSGLDTGGRRGSVVPLPRPVAEQSDSPLSVGVAPGLEKDTKRPGLGRIIRFIGDVCGPVAEAPNATSYTESLAAPSLISNESLTPAEHYGTPLSFTYGSLLEGTQACPTSVTERIQATVGRPLGDHSNTEGSGPLGLSQSAGLLAITSEPSDISASQLFGSVLGDPGIVPTSNLSSVLRRDR